MIDTFIKNTSKFDSNELLLKRCLVGILLVFCLTGVLMHLVQIFGFSKDPFPSYIVYILCGLFLLVNYYINNNQVIVNLLNLPLLIILTINCYHTGGVYSYNIKWLLLICFFSLLFLPKAQFFIWMISCLLIIIIFYVGNIGNPNDILEIDASTYFWEHVFYFFVIGLFIYVMFLTQNLLKTDILKKNADLKLYSQKMRKQSEELEFITNELQKSNQKLEDFAHTTSHDLKQPLNTMASFSELIVRDIEEGNIGDRTKEMLQFVNESSIKIKGLISNALASTKLSQSNEKEMRLINTKILVGDVIAQLGYQIDQKQAEIEINNLHEIHANGHQISRVFQNLISNSIKYAKVGVTPMIKISSKTVNKEIVFTVEDNGIGIKEKDIERIFDPHYQSDCKGNKGHGIGLSNCKDIIESLKGKLWVESVLGQYTKMHFSIP